MRVPIGQRTRRTSDVAGFTLIELLIVIIIIAILAAIAIPTFLGQRQRAQDAAAMTLVRNALTTFQGEFVDARDYTKVTSDALKISEPGVEWIQADKNLVDTDPAPWISPDIDSSAEDHEVSFFAESPTVIDLATKSESGNVFGIQVDTVSIESTGYVKVKVIEDSTSLGW